MRGKVFGKKWVTGSCGLSSCAIFLSALYGCGTACVRVPCGFFLLPTPPLLSVDLKARANAKCMTCCQKNIIHEPFTSVLLTHSKPVKQQVQLNGFSYPFVVKPDIGMKGLLFRKVDSEKELHTYHSQNQVDYIIQDLVEYPLEVSVFYYRYPDQQQGVITGFIQKELMDVTGDGKSTLWELIMAHAKARHRPEEMRIKHEAFLERVIPKDERYILTYAANLNRGARFTNLDHLIDEELLRVFDAISHHASFFYGRYDIKCTSVEDLKKGKNFSILEFNGSGAEPNHVYNAGYSLFGAYRVFLRHWKVLFEISRYNKDHGLPYWPAMKGWRFLREAKKHLKVLEKSDTEIII